jgi:hypothetical protein
MSSDLAILIELSSGSEGLPISTDVEDLQRHTAEDYYSPPLASVVSGRSSLTLRAKYAEDEDVLKTLDLTFSATRIPPAGDTGVTFRLQVDGLDTVSQSLSEKIVNLMRRRVLGYRDGKQPENPQTETDSFTSVASMLLSESFKQPHITVMKPAPMASLTPAWERLLEMTDHELTQIEKDEFQAIGSFEGRKRCRVDG